MNRIGIIDCGISNLTSVANAFQSIGADTIIVTDANRESEVSHLVLPGVGTFNRGMENLRREHLDELVHTHVSQGKPLLGICLGMQLLAIEGMEFGVTQGLGLIPGTVARIDLSGTRLRLPHIGWNDVELQRQSRLCQNLPEKPIFYFLHSNVIHSLASENIVGSCEYGVTFSAIVERDNVFGVQFHPEKSQKVGLQLLRNFTKVC